MIYVKQDAGLIPQELLDRALEAQQELETLPLERRADFIKSKAGIWRAFRDCLARMSHDKCWYSESPEVQSFFDVDHYRPKLGARRTEARYDRGYEWLAFSWKNLRLAAQRSNRLSTNEDTEETEGKGSWFPLADGSPSASWENRCEAQEQPILLDPAVPDDVELIDIDAEGRICPSKCCSAPIRVMHSAQLYGLDLPKLVSARKRVMRQIIDLHFVLMHLLVTGSAAASTAVGLQVEQIGRATLPNSPYSKAARAQLAMLGALDLCAPTEEAPG